MLKRLGGVAPTSALLQRGISAYRLTKSRSEGWLTSPRRGWVALSDADPALVFAARHGVILTCITQAKRLGLWVLNSDEPHVAARSRSAHPQLQTGVVHWSKPVHPRHPACLEDPIENVLDTIARCRPYEQAMAVWESALKLGLAERRALDQVQFGVPARRVLRDVTPFSDSGLESFVRVRLRSLGLKVGAQSWILGHRVDFLVEGWLVLQIDGGHHVGAQRTADIRHDAVLTAHGYRVLRLSYVHVVHDWPETQRVVMQNLARPGNSASTGSSRPITGPQ